MTVKNRFKLYLILGFLGAILAMGLSIFLLTMDRRTSPSRFSPTPVPSSAQPYPSSVPSEDPSIPTPTIDIPITGTGQLDEDFPEEYIKETNQSFDLRTRLPVKTDQFEIAYDNTNFRFIVTVKEPFEENVQIFREWIEKNGLSDIPQEDFNLQSIE